MDYLESRRVEQVVLKLAREYGLDGGICFSGIDGTPNRVEHRQEQLEAVWQKYIGSEQPTIAESQEKTPLPTRGVEEAERETLSTVIANMEGAA